MRPNSFQCTKMNLVLGTAKFWIPALQMTVAKPVVNADEALFSKPVRWRLFIVQWSFWAAWLWSLCQKWWWPRNNPNVWPVKSAGAMSNVCVTQHMKTRAISSGDDSCWRNTTSTENTLIISLLQFLRLGEGRKDYNRQYFEVILFGIPVSKLVEHRGICEVGLKDGAKYPRYMVQGLQPCGLW